MRQHSLKPSIPLIALLVSLACAEKPRPQPTTLTKYPHAMDRFARLRRAQFTDSNPQFLLQEMICEMIRVERVIGPDVEIRAALLEDSLKIQFPPARHYETERRLSGATYRSGDDSVCFKINEEAQLEVPLPLPKVRRTK